MLERHCLSSLAEVLRDELSLSLRCCLQVDLAEGGRALLVDKDKQPRWLYNHVDIEPMKLIVTLLAPSWTAAEHPLTDLGRD